LKRIEAIAVVALLAAFSGLCWKSQHWTSVTIDEFAHLPAGYYYWETGDLNLYAKNPPLVKLVAALPLLPMHPAFERNLGRFQNIGWRPWLFANDFMFRNQDRFIRIYSAGRAMVVLLGICLGLSIYIFARKKYGTTGALLSLTLFAFSPNMLAHAGMATVDMGACLFIFLAMVSLLRYLEKPGWSRAALAGVLLGLAQLAKFSTLSLLLIYFLAPLALIWPFKKDRARSRLLAVRYAQVGLMVLVWVVMVAVCYRGHGLFAPTADFKFSSHWMNRMQNIFRPLPAPFPKIYLSGLDGQLTDMEQGEFANYLNGKWYQGVNKKYFLTALLVKTPIPSQILFLAALLLAALPKKYRMRFSPEEYFILTVMAWIIFIFSVRNSLQIGVRYLMPAFPLAYVFAGRIGKALDKSSALMKAAPLMLLVWLFVESVLIYPHYLSYFNEYAGGPKNGHKVLLDSNLDWGQDLPSLADWMKEHNVDKVDLCYFGHARPQLYGVDYQVLGQGAPLKYTAISVQMLLGAGYFYYPMLFEGQGAVVRPELIKPFQNKQPVGHAGYSIEIFEND
jgi:4-amino-4-deoxy-L-arabinose transferase-like glycosyltransferase